MLQQTNSSMAESDKADGPSQSLSAGDYTQAGWIFKARKAARYVALFGWARTLVKVRGQYHMKATEEFAGPRWENQRCRGRDAPGRDVAIIGCGNYAYSNIAYYLRKYRRRFLRATYDRNKSRALSLCRAYGGAYALADWHDLLADPQVRTVFIASNHASHAEYAIACIEAGKHVHIEKPHVVSREQLDRLVRAMRQHPHSKVFLGFNRPRSRLFRRLQTLLGQQAGPLMVNWFIAGHHIQDGHWYFDEKEGGRVLGNLCHWSDLTLHLVALDKAFPCRIVAGTLPGAKSDFAVAVTFADRSCASITFSAKGHTFEGVREVLNVHRGDVLANLTDFEVLTADVVERKIAMRLRHRDHGHGTNIGHSLLSASDGAANGESAEYVAATAAFFLAIREAIDGGAVVDLSSADLAALGR
jgi:predicted dehydrogenase